MYFQLLPPRSFARKLELAGQKPGSPFDGCVDMGICVCGAPYFAGFPFISQKGD